MFYFHSRDMNRNTNLEEIKFGIHEIICYSIFWTLSIPMIDNIDYVRQFQIENTSNISKDIVILILS